MKSDTVTSPTDAIRRAFPVSNAPEGPLVLDECSFCVAINTALSGKTWDAVELEMLEENADSLPQLRRAAFAYYLPAFMCGAVAYPAIPGVSASDTLEFTIRHLCHPELPDDDWWNERLDLLSQEQRVAVAVFFAWAVGVLETGEEVEELKKRAQAGLERYWGRYLTNVGAGSHRVAAVEAGASEEEPG